MRAWELATEKSVSLEADAPPKSAFMAMDRYIQRTWVNIRYGRTHKVRSVLLISSPQPCVLPRARRLYLRAFIMPRTLVTNPHNIMKS